MLRLRKWSPATRPVPVEVVFQFAPGLDVRPAPNGAEVRTKLGWSLILEFDAPGAVSLSCGGQGYDQGWVSRRFGCKEPAARLSWKGVAPWGGLATHIRLRVPGEGRTLMRNALAEIA